MCGIAGAVSTELSADIVRQRVLAISDAQQHRGPDGHGVATFTDHAASLAHTRLSIIDLSEGGHQPKYSDDRRYCITYNGEIYNYQELRSELERLGESFSSQSDTEVILRLYQRDGEKMLSRLRGMYALFIWDSQQNIGFAARDPLGIKPLYYWTDQHSVAFASELRALLCGGFSSKAISKIGVQGYFASGSVQEPSTLVEDISLLPAGHSLVWNNGKISLSQHAKLVFGNDSISRDTALKKTREALIDSVKAHFVADVPVGIFLSGGIDSTALLALAKHATDQTINTYSIAFEDPAWNEGDIAKRVAKHFGSKHTELLMTKKIAQDLFQEFLEAIDQPTIDGFNTFCVAKLAYDNGEKVVLSGLGGDEVFAGYKSFDLLPKMARWSNAVRIAAPFFSLLSNRLAPLFSSRVTRVFDFLSEPGSLSAAHQSLRGIFSKAESRRLTTSFTGHASLNDVQRENSSNCENTKADQVSELELSRYLRNQLLRDSDVMSMAWGLELRVPFVDQKLIQTVAKIPSGIRLEYGKALLTDSVPEIPEWVVNRPKQGFRFPFEDWFDSNWSQADNELHLPKWIKLKPWYRAWSISVLKFWRKKYLLMPTEGSRTEGSRTEGSRTEASRVEESSGQ